MDIGFIGLGQMGRAIASRLLKAAPGLRLWNRSPDPARTLAAEGAEIVAAPADAFGGDAVFSMLADDQAIRAVLIDSGALDRAPAGLIHVNLSTISPTFAEELAARHQARGVAYVAAPVLGRPDAAAAGTLHILAAGPEAAIDRVQPMFDVIGQRTWRLGPVAQHANVVKLAANVMLGSAVETLAEACALVAAYAVQPRDLLQIVTNSNFPGPVYQGYGRLIAEQKYEPAGFKASLELKDVRLALAAADAGRIPLPIASVVHDSLLEALAQGDGEKDLAVLGRIAARRGGGQARGSTQP